MLIAMMGQSLAKLRGEAQLMAQFEHAKLVMLQEQNVLNAGVRERGQEGGRKSLLCALFRSGTTREQARGSSAADFTSGRAHRPPGSAPHLSAHPTREHGAGR